MPISETMTDGLRYFSQKNFLPRTFVLGGAAIKFWFWFGLCACGACFLERKSSLLLSFRDGKRGFLGLYWREIQMHYVCMLFFFFLFTLLFICQTHFLRCKACYNFR
ncbi:hypothetical protein AA313_de0203705 [Arthrobotrys entomopaga]|nr:hypothetical protein AA313_de0203705 [Arthrobotrys entomopaga]